MRNSFFPLLTLMLVSSHCAWTAGAPLTQVHPGFDLVNIRPRTFQLGVSGMDWLPDGRLAVTTYRNKVFCGYAEATDIYAFSNVSGNDPNLIQATKIASSFVESHGLRVVDGKTYVLHKYQLSELLDADGDGFYEGRRPVAQFPKPVEFPKHSFRDYGDSCQWEFGLEYQSGFFYVLLSSAWPPRDQGAERGNLVKVASDGTFENIVGGLRNPNGLVRGPDNELFGTDNQGEWLATNKLIHFKPGRFYGYRGNANNSFQVKGVKDSPPAIYIPQNDISNSPTNPIYLKEGMFKGQMLAGDITYGGIQRYFLEKVGEEYQGAVFRFTGGLESGIERILAGSDGSLYLGGLGGPGGNWNWYTKMFGLQRLKPNGRMAFEMKSISSRRNGMEVEFTKQLALGALQPSSFTVDMFWYDLNTKGAYGGEKHNTITLPVKSVELNADGNRAFLEIDGLKEMQVVHIVVNNLTSQAGEKMWDNESWYTLNAISPSQKFDVVPVTLERMRKNISQAPFSLKRTGGVLIFNPEEIGPYRLSLTDALGKIREVRAGQGSDPVVLSVASLESGIYVATLQAAGVKRNQIVVLP